MSLVDIPSFDWMRHLQDCETCGFRKWGSRWCENPKIRSEEFVRDGMIIGCIHWNGEEMLPK